MHLLCSIDAAFMLSFIVLSTAALPLYLAAEMIDDSGLFDSFSVQLLYATAFAFVLGLVVVEEIMSKPSDRAVHLIHKNVLHVVLLATLFGAIYFTSHCLQYVRWFVYGTLDLHGDYVCRYYYHYTSACAGRYRGFVGEFRSNDLIYSHFMVAVILWLLLWSHLAQLWTHSPSNCLGETYPTPSPIPGSWPSSGEAGVLRDTDPTPSPAPGSWPSSGDAGDLPNVFPTPVDPGSIPGSGTVHTAPRNADLGPTCANPIAGGEVESQEIVLPSTPTPKAEWAFVPITPYWKLPKVSKENSWDVSERRWGGSSARRKMLTVETVRTSPSIRLFPSAPIRPIYVFVDDNEFNDGQGASEPQQPAEPVVGEILTEHPNVQNSSGTGPVEGGEVDQGADQPSKPTSKPLREKRIREPELNEPELLEEEHCEKRACTWEVFEKELLRTRELCENVEHGENVQRLNGKKLSNASKDVARPRKSVRFAVAQQERTGLEFQHEQQLPVQDISCQVAVGEQSTTQQQSVVQVQTAYDSPHVATEMQLEEQVYEDAKWPQGLKVISLNSYHEQLKLRNNHSQQLQLDNDRIARENSARLAREELERHASEAKERRMKEATKRRAREDHKLRADEERKRRATEQIECRARAEKHRVNQERLQEEINRIFVKWSNEKLRKNEDDRLAREVKERQASADNDRLTREKAERLAWERKHRVEGAIFDAELLREFAVDLDEEEERQKQEREEKERQEEKRKEKKRVDDRIEEDSAWEACEANLPCKSDVKEPKEYGHEDSDTEVQKTQDEIKRMEKEREREQEDTDGGQALEDAFKEINGQEEEPTGDESEALRVEDVQGLTALAPPQGAQPLSQMSAPKTPTPAALYLPTSVDGQYPTFMNQHPERYIAIGKTKDAARKLRKSLLLQFCDHFANLRALCEQYGYLPCEIPEHFETFRQTVVGLNEFRRNLGGKDDTPKGSGTRRGNLGAIYKTTSIVELMEWLVTELRPRLYRVEKFGLDIPLITEMVRLFPELMSTTENLLAHLEPVRFQGLSSQGLVDNNV